MTTQSKSSIRAYADRRLLRWLERLWSTIETFFNRVLTPQYNPVYHLGTLSFYLLIVLTVTGIYLTIFYRPGSGAAYASVENISSTWIGLLMRSIHRYASSGLAILVALHAMKMFVSDRYWGSRWLTWVTGIGMAVFTWLIGTMGYWLIWDQRSQWMTEYLMQSAGSQVALTFLHPDLDAYTFMIFIIVLFLHVFLPLMLVLVFAIHVLRLARARWWSMRWAMIMSVLGLVVVSLVFPTSSAPPANLNELVTTIKLDWLYLGFLPVFESFGAVPVTIFTLGGLLVVGALPWLWRGKHRGPAVVIEPACTGCVLCAAECPYNAITMVKREDDTPYIKLAVVNADLCTGCGICTGTCATMAIELKHLPISQVYDPTRKAVTEAKQAGASPYVLFTCERLAASTPLPTSPVIASHNPLPVIASASEAISPSSSDSASPSLPISAHSLLTSNKTNGANDHSPESHPTITTIMPCVGMAEVDWLKQLRADGAKEIILLGCAFDDCNYREGPHWTSSRIRRRRGMDHSYIHLIEAAPGDHKPLDNLLAELGEKENKPPAPLPLNEERQKMFPKPSIAGMVLLLFTILFALAIPFDIPTTNVMSSGGQLRLAIESAGEYAEMFASPDMVLPEGVTTAQIFGGKKHPYNIIVTVDGETILEKTYQPAGIRNEGKIYGMEMLAIEPGEHTITIQLRTDGETWRKVYSGKMVIEPAKVYGLKYNEADSQFIPQTYE